MKLKYGGKTLAQIIQQVSSLNEGEIDHQKILSIVVKL